jgi:hypothetical protein
MEGVDEGGNAGVCFYLRGEGGGDDEQEKRGEVGGAVEGETHLKRLACEAEMKMEGRCAVFLRCGRLNF